MSVFLGLALGALFMLVLLGFIAHDDASAVVIKKAMSVSMEKVKGSYLGSMSNDTWVTNKDVVQISVTSESEPSQSTDRMLVDIDAKSGSVSKIRVSLELNYTGSGKTFKGNITINSTRATFIYTNNGLELGAKDGYSVSIIRHQPLVQAMANFNVDAAGPTISTTGVYTDYQVMDGTYYMKASGKINLSLQDSDPGADFTYFKTGSNVQYSWNGGSWTNWGGGTITTPSSNSILHVKATDRFNQVSDLIRPLRIATIQDANPNIISAQVSYSNVCLFLSNTTIKSSGSLTLTNCTLGFWGNDAVMKVEKGGSFRMKPPSSGSSISKIGSSGKNYKIETKTGSALDINGTTILGGMNDRSNTLLLREGLIHKSKITNLKTPIVIGSSNIRITDSEITTSGAAGGIRIDLNHTWSPKPVNLKGLTIDGSANVPISIANASVWKTHNSRDVLYAGDKNATYGFLIDRSSSQPENPYIQVPYFIDSRSNEAVLKIEYNDSGTWKLLSSFEKKNTISTEWVDGSSSVMDISSTPLVTNFRIIWNVTKTGSGCAYLQKPVYGASGVVPSIPAPKDNTWDAVTSKIVAIESVSIKNASRSFIEVRSSGLVDISGLKAGGFNMSAPASSGLFISDSNVSLRSSTIKTDANGAVGIRSNFAAGDDWAHSYISGTKISNSKFNQSNGILSNGGYLQLASITVTDAMVGIKTTATMPDINVASVHAKDRAIDIGIPSGFIGSRSMNLNGISAGDYTNEGVLISGSISSDWFLKIRSFELASSAVDPHVRGSGIGGLTLNIGGSGKIQASLQGNVTDGNAHGIAVKGIPAGSFVNVTGPSAASTMMLDGIYIGSPCEVNIVNSYLKNNQKQGIFVCTGSDLTVRGALTEVTGNREGGIYAEATSEVSLINANVSQNNGPGLTLMNYATATLDGVDMYSNIFGIDARAGSKADIKGCLLNINSNQGIKAKGSDMVFSSPLTTISGNGRDGIFADGGSLDAMYLISKLNSGDGIRLWNVKLHQMERVESRDNGGNGLSIHVGTKALLGPNDSYGQFVHLAFTGNHNIGISFTYDPSTIDTQVEVGMTEIILHSNSLMDLDSPAMVHFTWTMNGFDTIGSPTSEGKARANMDIVLSSITPPTLQNEAITLLTDGNSFTVPGGSTLFLTDVDIAPLRSSSHFNITLGPNGALNINGGSLHNLDGINAVNANRVTLTDVHIDNLLRPIVLGCPFTITGCTFDGAPGTSMTIVSDQIAGGTKKIEDTLIANSSIGLHIVGNVSALTIKGCEFQQNDVGVLFDSENHQYINKSRFISNNVPIKLVSGNLSLFDSEIEKPDVKVERGTDRIDIGFTLTVRVVDEEGVKTGFVLNLTRGTGSAAERVRYDIGKEKGYTFEKGLVSYTIRSTSFNPPINQTFVNVTVEVTHGYKEKAETFDHTMTRDIFYTMFSPPKVQTANVKYSLSAFEDRGLKNGPEDIRTWFLDSDTDQSNLTYSAVSLGNNVRVLMDGSRLNLSLKKDFNGNEKIRITATDPHGMASTVEVMIVVLPMNDLPVASHARILINGVESATARTGDNLTAAWDWSDVDIEEQPTSKRLIWYLNGEAQSTLEGIETVRNVQPGQYWNFTVYPADALSFSSGKFGSPINSPGIMVANIAPVLQGITLSPENPKTDDTLKAIPGKWSDPDSTRVYFHYEWQKKGVGSGWIVLSAPDSPNLPGSYFSKGDVIQVRAWITDGFSTSDSKTATVTIQNSPPSVLSARLEPEKASERTQYVRVVDIETSDPDSDTVTLNFIWSDSGTLLESGFDILYSSKWSYPDHVNISVSVIPYDNEMGEGRPYLVKMVYVPTDTDGDGLFDDANGNSENDPGDDLDDDNDGFNDSWEKLLMKDPADPQSYPQDWDRDGKPDGDPRNTEEWMDTDDDGDGIADDGDSYPLNPLMPGDFDRDGIGDDRDSDKDNDGVLAYEDQDDFDPTVGKKASGLRFSALEIILIIILVLIVIAIGGTGYAVYNGQIRLPSNAPPEVVSEREEKPHFRSKRDIALDALEDIDLEDMMVCSVCGEVVKKDDESCPNCRLFFSDDTEELISPEEEFVAEEE